MRILLDEEPCTVAGDSVAEAIANAAALMREKGRLIVEIVVDGQQWTSEQLDDHDLLDAIADELRMVSAEPRELASQVLADAGEALDTAESHQVQAAEMIQAGRTAEGLTELNEALSIWLSVQQAVEQACEVAGIDLGSVGPPDATASETLSRLQACLEEIKKLLVAQDMVGVADSLLYDVPPVLQSWREALAHMSREITEM